MDALEKAVRLRMAEVEDRELLYEIYASSRADEMALAGWPEEQKAAFLRMQFEAQDKYYRAEYDNAVFEIILFKGEPAGRLYQHPRETEIRIMDITLLPAFRGKGIGSFLLKRIMDQAASRNRAVSIHVEVFNRAMRLYTRLGFKKVADRGVYLLMEWRPEGATPNG